MIRFSKVSFAYANSPGPILSEIDLEIGPGFVALLGANGSGKSSLLKLVNGVLCPTAGSVSVEGSNPADPHEVWAVRARVGTCLQNPDNQMVAARVEEEVAFSLENAGIEPGIIRSRVAEILKRLRIEHLAGANPGGLSGGERQKVALAGALALDPACLVLDEPTSMLDPRSRGEALLFFRELAAEGKCVLMATNRSTDALLADRAIVLAGGGIALDAEPRRVLGSDVLEAAGVDRPLSCRLSRLLGGAEGSANTALTPRELAMSWAERASG
ncbi:MAG: ATP-binding cassette domain-containing protein [Candidatus Aquicultorales bacterium]